MRRPVIDLHCDLLSYLVHEKGRGPKDAISRSSLPQMLQGNVAIQLLAIFSSNTSKAFQEMQSQLAAFEGLLLLEKPARASEMLFSINEDMIVEKQAFLPCIENASGLAMPHQSIHDALSSLDSILKRIGPLGYISLTWDGENRFAGGCGSNVGLKEDGKALIEHMDQRGIPIDLSHASDHLIDDIFNFTDKKSLKTPLLASHSNFREITDKARNLPRAFAQEIIRRDGIIGLNFFCHFSGGIKALDITKHVEYAIELGAEDHLAIGADFFCDADFPHIKDKYKSDKCFYRELASSSCYPTFLSMLQNELGLNEKVIDKIAFNNAKRFYQRALSQ